MIDSKVEALGISLVLFNVKNSDNKQSMLTYTTFFAIINSKTLPGHNHHLRDKSAPSKLSKTTCEMWLKKWLREQNQAINILENPIFPPKKLFTWPIC